MKEITKPVGFSFYQTLRQKSKWNEKQEKKKTQHKTKSKTKMKSLSLSHI